MSTEARQASFDLVAEPVKRGKTVQDRDGDLWQRTTNGWWRNRTGRGKLKGKDLVALYGPLGVSARTEDYEQRFPLAMRRKDVP